MQIQVGYTNPADTRSYAPGAEVPSRARAEGAGELHAVTYGSRIALCGAPVSRVSEVAWPPESGAVCPRCVEAIRAYVE
jgi:hypothetical protein